MYVTIGRVRIKVGMGDQFRQIIEGQADVFEAGQVAGFVVSYVYRMDADPNEFYVVAVMSKSDRSHAYRMDTFSVDYHAKKGSCSLEG